MAVTAKLTANIQIIQTKDIGPSDVIASVKAGRSDGYLTEDTTTPNTTYVVRRIISSGSSFTIDLNGATLKDIYGNTAAFVNIKGLLVVNHSDAPYGGQTANTNARVTVSGNFITSRLGANTQIPLAAGDKIMLDVHTEQPEVTNTSADEITITETASLGAAYVDVIIYGEAIA